MVRVYSGDRDASLNADDMASQTVRLKEEQLRKEEEKVITIIGLLSHIINLPRFLPSTTRMYMTRACGGSCVPTSNALLLIISYATLN